MTFDKVEKDQVPDAAGHGLIRFRFASSIVQKLWMEVSVGREGKVSGGGKRIVWILFMFSWLEDGKEGVSNVDIRVTFRSTS